MPVFDPTNFLDKPSADFISAPPVPMATYPGIVTSVDFTEKADPFEKDKSKQKPIQIIRVNTRLLDWPAEVPEAQRSYADDDGTLIPIDLNRRTYSLEFLGNESGVRRLNNFLRSCGHGPDGTPYRELCARIIGQRVSVVMGQYINSRTKLPGSQVNDLYGEVPVSDSQQRRYA